MEAAGVVGRLLLFAGAVRPTPLLRAAGRNVLDLPMSADRTIGQQWLAAREELSTLLGAPPPLSVLIDRKSAPPRSMPEDQASIQPDDVAFLGTGGVLRAAAEGLTGMMLVATGGSLLTRPLPELLGRLMDLNADVALLAEHDGTPTGLMLVSAEVMRRLPGAGYMDFKEQCLPKIADRYQVRVAFAADHGRVCLPIRDREQYLEALAHHHAGRPFAIVEEGARVSPSARLLDAVVLAGAQVGPNCVVARSVLGPGAVVGSRAVLTDRALGASA